MIWVNNSHSNECCRHTYIPQVCPQGFLKCEAPLAQVVVHVIRRCCVKKLLKNRGSLQYFFILAFFAVLKHFPTFLDVRVSRQSVSAGRYQKTTNAWMKDVKTNRNTFVHGLEIEPLPQMSWVQPTQRFGGLLFCVWYEEATIRKGLLFATSGTKANHVTLGQACEALLFRKTLLFTVQDYHYLLFKTKLFIHHKWCLDNTVQRCWQ